MKGAVQINPQLPAQVHGAIVGASRMTPTKGRSRCPPLRRTFSRAVYSLKWNKQVKVLTCLDHYFSGILSVYNDVRL